MTDQNQPGSTPGRWVQQSGAQNGYGAAGGAPGGYGQVQAWTPYGPGAPGAAGQAGPAGPSGAGGVLANPLIVAAAAGVLFLFSVLGLFLRWMKVSLDMSQGGYGLRVEVTMNGFGVMKLTENLTGSSEHETSAEYMVLGVVALLALVAGIVVIALRRAPGIGASLVAAGGVLEVVSALLGLTSDKKDSVTGAQDGMSDYERQLLSDIVDNIDVSKGPGQYLVILAGLLLVAVGVGYLVLTLRGSRDIAPAVAWQGGPGTGRFQVRQEQQPGFQGQQSWPQNPQSPGQQAWTQGQQTPRAPGQQTWASQGQQNPDGPQTPDRQPGQQAGQSSDRREQDPRSPYGNPPTV